MTVSYMLTRQTDANGRITITLPDSATLPDGTYNYTLLDEAGTYYLATVEGDQPRVRPFGTALVYEGRLYIQTGKVKNVSRQIAANPKVEICAFHDGKWIRIAGELVNDDRREPKAAMLDKMPVLKAMYSADDDNTQVLYFKDAVATLCSFTDAPEEIRL